MSNKKRSTAICFLLLAFSILAVPLLKAQSTILSIEQCYALAKEHYPLVKQKELIEKTKEYNIQNISKNYLPQFSIAGQATYQSDVTQIPISFPGIDIPTPTKDQYKVYGEINQPLTDLLMIEQQKELQRANASVEEQKIEVELYKLKERINQIYFGILFIKEQLQQTTLLKKDIQSGISKMNAAIANGVALKSSTDALKAELLKIEQHTIELRAAQDAYMNMLGLFIDQAVTENTVFEKPQANSISQSISRPELALFDYQKKNIDLQNKILTIKNLPKVGLFFQAGYGQPSPLNMLNDDVDNYYIGGLRVNWSLTGLYTLSNERKLLDLNQNLLDIQKETFLFNTNLTLKQQNTDIHKFQELIKTDQEIITLRTSIKNTATIQLENGSITTNDYLHEVNAEDQAKQNLLLHQIQLLMAQYNYQTTAGN